MAASGAQIVDEAKRKRRAEMLRETPVQLSDTPTSTFGKMWHGGHYERDAEGGGREVYKRTGIGDLVEGAIDFLPGKWLQAAVMGGYAGEAEGAGLKAISKAAKRAAGLRKAPEKAGYAGDVKQFEARPGEALPEETRFALRTRYPEQIPGTPAVDSKSGKAFIEKQLSPEALAVQKQRNLAQKDIDAGNYTPYFDVSQRAHVDPANYPMKGETITAAMPKKAETIAQHMSFADTPETRARLTAGYLRGMQNPLAKDWYAMKQLEDEFVAELGPDAGRQAFREMWEAMAATTGGANPKDNLMMAHYGQFMRGQGRDIPKAGHELPFPIGGRYASGNLAQFSKLADTPMADQFATNPKRHNFAANFLGHRDLATIDEQMMKGFDPTGTLKAPQWYGINQTVINDLAKQHGVMPQNFQDVAWAGLGEKEISKPMIQQVNEAIERTSRITGQKPDEVLKQNIIRKMGPLFGLGTLGVGLGGQMIDEQQQPGT